MKAFHLACFCLAVIGTLAQNYPKLLVSNNPKGQLVVPGGSNGGSVQSVSNRISNSIDFRGGGGISSSGAGANSGFPDIPTNEFLNGNPGLAPFDQWQVVENSGMPIHGAMFAGSGTFGNGNLGGSIYPYDQLIGNEVQMQLPEIQSGSRRLPGMQSGSIQFPEIQPGSMLFSEMQSGTRQFSEIQPGSIQFPETQSGSRQFQEMQSEPATIHLGNGFQGISVHPDIPYIPPNSDQYPYPVGTIYDMYSQSVGPISHFNNLNSGGLSLQEQSALLERIPFENTQGNDFAGPGGPEITEMGIGGPQTQGGRNLDTAAGSSNGMDMTFDIPGAIRSGDAWQGQNMDIPFGTIGSLDIGNQDKNVRTGRGDPGVNGGTANEIIDMLKGIADGSIRNQVSTEEKISGTNGRNQGFSDVNTRQTEPSGANTERQGSSNANAKRQGSSNANTGRQGSSNANTGRQEPSNANTGRQGSFNANPGSQGSSNANTGSQGSSNANSGNRGTSVSNTGRQGSSNANSGLQALSGANAGRQGNSGANTGSRGSSGANTGSQPNKVVVFIIPDGFLSKGGNRLASGSQQNRCQDQNCPSRVSPSAIDNLVSYKSNLIDPTNNKMTDQTSVTNTNRGLSGPSNTMDPQITDPTSVDPGVGARANGQQNRNNKIFDSPAIAKPRDTNQSNSRMYNRLLSYGSLMYDKLTRHPSSYGNNVQYNKYKKGGY